jgi:hypothetical protein
VMQPCESDLSRADITLHRNRTNSLHDLLIAFIIGVIGIGLLSRAE